MLHAAGMASKADTRRGAKAPRRSAAEWADEVAAWKRSGQTAGEYARMRGISAGTLKWWSSRKGSSAERRAPKRTRASGAGKSAKGMAVGFLPVQVSARARVPERATARATELLVEIELVGGRRVRVAGGLGFEQLARLLDLVEGGR